MTIHVHIERLVLDSAAAPHETQGLRRGLQQELTTLLREGGLSDELRQGAAVPAVRGGSIDPPPHRTPSPLGSRIARAVYDGIGARRS